MSKPDDQSTHVLPVSPQAPKRNFRIRTPKELETKGNSGSENHVERAIKANLPAWLRLAAEVEHLFGPMVEEPGFVRYDRTSM